MTHPTTLQLSNRERLGNIVKTRTDEPLRDDLLDGQGSYCFLGLCFEVMRINKPEEYVWKGNAFITVGGELDIPKSVNRANKALCEWLGIKEDKLWRITIPNDDGVSTWDDLWEEFERITKEGDDG